MDRRVYRVYRARYARLDGEGARRVGGRWNSAGRSVVYMAESVALAVLENLVHMARQDFPAGSVCVSAVIPSGVRTLSERDLRGRDAVVPHERNDLLNPVHPDFARIVAEPPALFHFDPGLFA